ncbi:MAG: aminoacyl-histidine dipeptidase [bacterium]|nr:aminoacyl-histidine dipeptidase [bacterium]
MKKLINIEPKEVMGYFEDICAIPHGSGNTKMISDYLVEFAKKNGFEYRQDELNNVIIFAPGSAGYENSPSVIIQGHMDMVAEKTEDCPIDMEKDGLDLYVEDGFVKARGTTLGGDDGIAIAYALAAMTSAEVVHPPIEAVFTVDEETGMKGAAGIDVSELKGRIMLNIDSEQENVFTVSCAGGANAYVTIPTERENTEGIIFEITVNGLKGGHSGVEIDKGRGNSNILMGRLLYAIKDKIKLCSIKGGSKGNAIPLSTTAVIVASEDISDIVAEYEKAFRNELRSSDENVRIVCTNKGKGTQNTASATQKIIAYLMTAPNGIYAYSMEIAGLVQTSLNLGILELKEDKMTALYAVRSSVGTQRIWLCNMLKAVAESLGGTAEFDGIYSEWEYKKDSRLRDLMIEVYKEQYGKEPVIEAIHAGVECGIFAGKLPGLDCVSFGPDLFEIHTVRERMGIESVQRTWKLIKEVLRRLI